MRSSMGLVAAMGDLGAGWERNTGSGLIFPKLQSFTVVKIINHVTLVT